MTVKCDDISGCKKWICGRVVVGIYRVKGCGLAIHDFILISVANEDAGILLVTVSRVTSTFALGLDSLRRSTNTRRREKERDFFSCKFWLIGEKARGRMRPKKNTVETTRNGKIIFQVFVL